MSKIWPSILTSTGIILSSLLPAYAYAEDASYDNGMVDIPAMTFDGDNLVSTQLQLINTQTWDFEVVSTTDLFGNPEPSATYDPQSLILHFPVVRVQGKRFEVSLLYIPNSDPVVFRLASVKELADDPENNIANTPSDLGEAISLYTSKCSVCHGADGKGSLAGPSLAGCTNCNNETTLINYISENMPTSNPAACTDNCASQIAQYIITSFNNTTFDGTIEAIGGIELLSHQDTLRKASLNIISRLPSNGEKKLVREQGDVGLDSVLDSYFNSKAFYDRLIEIYNDVLLTDKYMSFNGSQAAINLLSDDDYPNRKWYYPESGDWEDENYLWRKLTNDAVAREPLQLIAHVVKNDLPFTEILTADYMMVNPYSARSYSIDNTNFNDDTDPEEFHPGQAYGIPHAGILTSAMFLNRYPTTFTNRNRGRSYVTYKFFLDLDILAIPGGMRPVGASDIDDAIPTLDNENCTVCHTVLDPVASAFQNWDKYGRYRPSRLFEGWFPDMLPTGYSGSVMPLAGNLDNSLQWIAAEMATDVRFARSTVKTIWQGLTGKAALTAPEEGSLNYNSNNLAYQAENQTIENITTTFIDSGYNLKTVFKEILLSPYYRANGLDSSANVLANQTTGISRLLTPEMLDRKLKSLFGFSWIGELDKHYKYSNRRDKNRLLNDWSYYHQLYGGIDSDETTKRLTDPNGLMAAVQERMANEMACYAVPNEFLFPRTQRLLFPYVARDTRPTDSDGYPVESSVAAIKANIQHLHEHLLGERLPLDHLEISNTYNLFMSIYSTGQDLMENANYSWEVEHLPGECQRHRDFFTGESLDQRENGGQDRRIRSDSTYILRTWMGIIAYLMTDYKFLYE